MTNRKLLLVVTGLSFGGAEKIVCDLADYFSKNGNNQVVICTLINLHKIGPKNREVDVVSLGMKKNPISLLVGLFKYLRLIRNFKPDLVHSHLFHSNIFCRGARIFGGSYFLVNSVHSMSEGGKVTDLLYRVTDSLAVITTNVSKKAATAFSLRKAGRIVPIPNGVDLSRFFPPEGKMKTTYFNILNVGRLVKEKNQRQLIRVVCRLVKKYPQIKLKIVGDGPLEKELKQDVAYLGLEACINVTKSTDNIVRDYQSADLLVLSSIIEGFGLVVAEAMACGLPVVVTNSGGPPEIVGELGTVVPVNDDDAMAKAIQSYIEMTIESREETGKKNRNRIAAQFSQNEFFFRWSVVYGQILLKELNKINRETFSWYFQS